MRDARPPRSGFSQSTRDLEGAPANAEDTRFYNEFSKNLRQAEGYDYRLSSAVQTILAFEAHPEDQAVADRGLDALQYLCAAELQAAGVERRSQGR